MALIRLARQFNRPDVDAFLESLSDEQLFEQLAYDEVRYRAKSDAAKLQRMMR